MLYSQSSKADAESAIDKIIADLEANWVPYCPQSGTKEICLQTAIEKHCDVYLIKNAITEEVEKLTMMEIPKFNDTSEKEECIKLMKQVKESIL